MKKIFILSALFIGISIQSQEIKLEPFDKVIISPYVSAILKKGDKESMKIIHTELPKEKIYTEVKNKTLWIYLEGVKILDKGDGFKKNHTRPMYKGTMINVRVTYKALKTLSIRGEENILCEGLIEQEKLTVRAYGSPKITLEQVRLKNMNVTIYGEGILNIQKGIVEKEKFKLYGSSQIDVLGVNADNAVVNTYGNSQIKLKAAKSIKVMSFGDSSVVYEGEAKVYNKSFGSSTIKKLN